MRLTGQTIKHHDERLGEVELEVQLHRYARGRRPRIDLFHPEQGPWATLTVNDPAVKLGPGEILIKTWEGDEWRSVLASGLLVDTGRREQMGYVKAHVWRLAEGVEL